MRRTVRFLRRHDRGQGQVLRFRGVAEPSLHETADHEFRLWRFGWVGQTFYEGQHERLGGRSARPTARRLSGGFVPGDFVWLDQAVKALRGTAWAEHDCRHQCGGLAGYCGVEGSRDFPSCELLGVALPDLGAGHRRDGTGQADNRGAMASQRLPVSLALAITPSGTTQDRHGNPCFDPPYEQGQPIVGGAPHPRRTAQARHQDQPGHGWALDALAPQGPLPDLAELPAQPPSRHCGDRHVCGHHRDVPAPLYLDRARPRSQAGRSLRSHRKSYARLAFRPNDRGASWDTAPRYLLRDRGKSYGPAFRHRVRAMGITEVITAARSPGRIPTPSVSSDRSAANVWITLSSSASVTCAACCRAIFNITMTPERISRSTRIVHGLVPYSYPSQAITLLPSRRSAACIIAMSVEPRRMRGGTVLLVPAPMAPN